ncbi:class I SAM-dependent rRNA methyltransferase [Patiriisocius sp. Uisw_017]|jgi:23S rRNA (cytosine1962-C5)-methyltransferase|uniref:class I SAM-dependent rRNA methyltransferase n=1 Tax=Patiriisocius sp. Uisw_017 TaxID=3230968 RepID=UPI0039EC6C2D
MFSTPLVPVKKPQVLAVKLSAMGERSVRASHPWIFSDSIIKINKVGAAGDIAVIFSHTTNKAMGVGLYDPDSPIKIKMLHYNEGVALNAPFFAAKIKKAFALRTKLLLTKTNSYRLLFGENDGFPGFIADVYNKVLVVKLYSSIWFPYLEVLLEQLIATSNCDTVVLRLNRKLQQQNNYNLRDGMVLYGELRDPTIVFKEHGVTFSANVIKGHKTGYFLDHRHNRKRVGELSQGKTVLDVFSYAGGFSVHALANDAKEVTSIDISEQALKLAKENGKLNHFAGKHNTLAGDAFELLKKLISENKKYQVVIIDPPSFAKSKKEITIALKKYKQLADLGAQLTTKGGLLVLASCSSRIAADEFFELNEATLKSHKQAFKTILKTNHDSDHPIGFPEGSYLKCGYYRF